MNFLWKLPKSYVIYIISFGVAIRIIYSLSIGLEMFPDSKSYMLNAMVLLSEQWSDFAVERTIGYPLFLMLTMKALLLFTGHINEATFGITLVALQSILGITTALLCADIAKRLFNNNKLALIVALLIQVSESQLFYEHAVLTETAYTFFLISNLYILCLSTSSLHFGRYYTVRQRWFLYCTGMYVTMAIIL